MVHWSWVDCSNHSVVGQAIKKLTMAGLVYWFAGPGWIGLMVHWSQWSNYLLVLGGLI